MQGDEDGGQLVLSENEVMSLRRRVWGRRKVNMRGFTQWTLKEENFKEYTFKNEH